MYIQINIKYWMPRGWGSMQKILFWVFKQTHLSFSIVFLFLDILQIFTHFHKSDFLAELYPTTPHSKVDIEGKYF